MKYALWLALICLCVPARAQTAAENVKTAETLIKEGRLEEAIVYLDRAIGTDPKSLVARSWRGTARFKSGDAAGAIQDLSIALELNPYEPYTHFWRGMAYNQQKRHQEAIADYSVVITQKGVNADYHYLSLAYRGGSYDMIDREKEARKDLDAAIKFNPRRAEAWIGRARLRRSLGDHVGAREDFARADAIDPDMLATTNAYDYPKQAGLSLPSVLFLGAIFTLIAFAFALALRHFMPDLRTNHTDFQDRIT